MIPVIGEAADLVNGVWYAAQGDWKNAAMSFASMIPVAGAAIAGTRLGAKAVKYATKYTSRISKASPVRKVSGWTSRSGPRAGAGKAGGGKSGWSSSGSSKKLWSGKGSGGKPATSGSRRTASGPACKNSFVPGTEVLLADSTSKPIEELKGGDKVLATDPSTGRTEAREVTAAITGEGDKNLVEITITTAEGKTDSVTATDEHPFWLPEQKKWVNATELQPGQWLQTSAGTKVQITAIRRHTQQQRVHNLTVDDFHTYYVVAGATPLLTHNCDVGSVANGLPKRTKDTDPTVGQIVKIGDTGAATKVGDPFKSGHASFSDDINEFLVDSPHILNPPRVRSTPRSLTWRRSLRGA